MAVKRRISGDSNAAFDRTAWVYDRGEACPGSRLRST